MLPVGERRATCGCPTVDSYRARMTIRRRTLIVVLGVVVTVGWAVAAAPAWAARTPDTTPSTTSPGDYRSALTARLAVEWGDPALAADLVGGFDDAFVASLEAKVPLGAVASSPLLTYRPARRAAKAFDSVVVYAFGYRDGADGTRAPGPTNEALADATRALLKRHPGLPVYAQSEIAEVLAEADLPGVVSIDPVVGPDGGLVYLSTAGVIAQARDKADAAGVDLGRIAVVAFSDHLGRSLLTTEAAGLDAGVAKGVALPTAYDPESAQPWTRDRRSYLATDLSARVATLGPSPAA